MAVGPEGRAGARNGGRAWKSGGTRRQFAVLLSVAGPVCVAILLAQTLAAPLAPDRATVALRAALADTDVEVVVLGSSIANRGVDLDALSDALDLPAAQVARHTLPYASMAHWYATLDHEVFGRGARPRQVVIVDLLASMLHHDGLTRPSSADRLLALLGPDEPEVAARALGVTPGRWRWLWARARAGQARDSLVARWRDAVLRTTWAPGAPDAALERLREGVNATVFGAAAMQAEAERVAIEVPETTGDFRLREHALLGSLARLARAHGAEVWLVRAPLPVSNADLDAVPSDVEADARAWMAELGLRYADLRGMRLSARDFEDTRHLTPEAARRFSRALAEVLRGDGDAPTASAQVSSWTMEDPGGACGRVVAVPGLAGFPAAWWLEGGLPPPLEARSDVPLRWAVAVSGCDGGVALAPGGVAVGVEAPVILQARSPTPDDAGVWVAPGAQLEVEGAGAAGSLRARASGVVALAVGASASMWTPTDGLVRATWPAHEGPLTLRAPPDGWVFVHHLQLGEPPSAALVVGSQEAARGRSVRVVGGRVDDVAVRPRYEHPPPPLPPWPRLRARDGLQVARLGALAPLADAPTWNHLRPNACNPVRVLEDGRPLEAHTPCPALDAGAAGASCSAGSLLAFRVRGDGPIAPRLAWTLDPRRACPLFGQEEGAALRGSWWLYPGDVARVAVPAAAVADTVDGLAVLDLDGLALVATPTRPVQVRLLRGDVEVLSAPWWLQPPGTPSRARLALSSPLPPAPGPLSLELRHDDPDAFLLWSLAALAEEPTDEPAARTPVVRAMRLGEIPPPPRAVDVGVSEGGATQLRAYALWPVSSTHLGKLGLSPWSPVRVRRGDILLPAVASVAAGVEAGAAALHIGHSLLVWPDADGARLELDAAVPLRPPDGSPPAWWAYPGTALVLDVTRAPALSHALLEVVVLTPPKDEAQARVRVGVARGSRVRGADRGEDVDGSAWVALDAATRVPGPGESGVSWHRARVPLPEGGLEDVRLIVEVGGRTTFAQLVRATLEAQSGASVGVEVDLASGP